MTLKSFCVAFFGVFACLCMVLAVMESLAQADFTLGAQKMTLKTFCVAFLGALACLYKVFGVAE